MRTLALQLVRQHGVSKASLHLSARRQHGASTASARRQHGVNTASARRQGGVSTASGWRQHGVRAASARCQGGVRAASARLCCICQHGVSTASLHLCACALGTARLHLSTIQIFRERDLYKLGVVIPQPLGGPQDRSGAVACIQAVLGQAPGANQPPANPPNPPNALLRRYLPILQTRTSGGRTGGAATTGTRKRAVMIYKRGVGIFLGFGRLATRTKHPHACASVRARGGGGRRSRIDRHVTLNER